MKRISELILYKDHHLMVFNKPGGLLTQEDTSGDSSAHRMAMAYAHRDLYVVHRLDRRVSGVLVFAKTKAAAAHLSKQWEQRQVRKVYLGIVPLKDIAGNGKLKHFLTYDSKKNLTRAHTTPVAGADEAELNYQILHTLDNFMLIRIDLISGRKHQIRAQMAAMDLPIRGDIKYGAKRTNPEGGIDLHAYALQFHHPSNQEEKTIIAPFPEGGLWRHVPAEVLTGI